MVALSLCTSHTRPNSSTSSPCRPSRCHDVNNSANTAPGTRLDRGAAVQKRALLSPQQCRPHEHKSAAQQTTEAERTSLTNHCTSSHSLMPSPVCASLNTRLAAHRLSCMAGQAAMQRRRSRRRKATGRWAALPWLA